MKIRKELKVGLLAITAALILYQGLSFLKGNDFFSSQTHYQAIFNDVQGLKISTPVTISGFPIGRVDDIVLLQDDSNKIKVIFKIDDDIKLNDNSKLILASDGLLGDKMMKLDVGIGDRPLEPGAVVEAEIEPSVTDVVAQELLPLRDEVTGLMSNINSFVDTLERSEENITATFENLSQATGNLNSITRTSRPAIQQIMVNIQQITAELKGDIQNVDVIITNLEQLTTNLKQIDMANTVRKLDATGDNLVKLTNELQQGKGTAGKLLKDDSLYNNLNLSVQQLESLLKDIEENPKRYVHFSVFGGKDKK